jgi:hypothetical protein
VHPLCHAEEPFGAAQGKLRGRRIWRGITHHPIPIMGFASLRMTPHTSSKLDFVQKPTESLRSVIPACAAPMESGQWRLVSNQRAVSGLRLSPERRRKLPWLLPRTQTPGYFWLRRAAGSFRTSLPESDIQKAPGMFWLHSDFLAPRSMNVQSRAKSLCEKVRHMTYVMLRSPPEADDEASGEGLFPTTPDSSLRSE